jgi:hypothetical protein
MTNDLKPCPFCGGEDIETRDNAYWTGKSSAILSVTINHWCITEEGHPQNIIQIKGNNRQEAINKWNTRAISADERIKELEREVQHWKSNHACEVERARVLKDRTDMPLERVQAYEQISEMKEQLRRLKSFARDFAAIGKYTGGFISTCYFEKLSKDYQICDDADWLKD